MLDAGADPNTGFWTTGLHRERETVLYGAAGVAHHAELTRLLLERGADPNDEEAVYHSPETYDNAAMKLLVETGKLTAENLSLMLIRKHDWHDYEGMKYLLERGVDPNYHRERGPYPILLSSTVVPLPIRRTSVVGIVSTQPFQQFEWSLVLKVGVAVWFVR